MESSYKKTSPHEIYHKNNPFRGTHTKIAQPKSQSKDKHRDEVESQASCGTSFSNKCMFFEIQILCRTNEQLQ